MKSTETAGDRVTAMESIALPLGGCVVIRASDSASRGVATTLLQAIDKQRDTTRQVLKELWTCLLGIEHLERRVLLVP